MEQRETLFNKVYDLAQNMHDMYELRPDIWEDLGDALDTLWDTAYNVGQEEGYDDGYDEGCYDTSRDM